MSGADDIRVYVGEAYLLERALHDQGIPVKLLIFPVRGMNSIKIRGMARSRCERS